MEVGVPLVGTRSQIGQPQGIAPTKINKGFKPLVYFLGYVSEFSRHLWAGDWQWNELRIINYELRKKRLEFFHI